MNRPNIAQCAETVTDLYVNRLPKAYGYNSTDDIQIICPSKKGELGTVSLNRKLQAMLNPPSKDKETFESGSKVFREGDKVMQTKNNYNIEWESDDEKGTGIFNGDIGILEKIDINSGLVTINFDGRIAELPAENLADLDLSYAITVHKSQGSEFKAVIIPAMGVVPNLAYRNLLYTAVTRAKDMLITVGSGDLIYKMTANDKKAKRYSALSHFLKAEF
jgi:exodeoxyribonuclease V alpha subunit